MLDNQFSSQNHQNTNGNFTRRAPPTPRPPPPGLGVAVAPVVPVVVEDGTPDLANKWLDSEYTDREYKKMHLNDNLSNVDRAILLVSEFCGTLILVFLGCMGCVIGFGAPNEGAPAEQISLTFGLAIMVAVQCFGHISGAHINPIVTVAAATMGVLPLIQVPIYLVGQFLGGLGGFGLVKLVTPNQHLVITNNGTVISGVCSPGIHPNLTAFQGCVVEFITSFILVLAVCAVWDQRNSTKQDSVPLKLGLTVAVLAMASGSHTGANMNPARSFAPALINGDWDNHWVYWVGPLLAGFLAGLFYRFLFIKEQPETESVVTPANKY